MKRILFAALAAILLFPAAASARDRNGDRLPDSWERGHGLSLKKDQSRRDQDSDGVRNLAEFRHGLDPRDDDSDDDGTADGSEAGRVTSFDDTTGELVITTIDGTALSGLVDDTTEIRCDESDDSFASASRHGHDDDEGDDDDHSGPGHDGDDDHGDDDHDEDEDQASCSTSALVPGAVVHEAELKIRSTGKVWEEIELV